MELCLALPIKNREETMIIEIENLHKSFKDVKAVDGLSFSVREGELFAFLGVNGAGKSTTINIISGILNKDDGTVLVCGENIDIQTCFPRGSNSNLPVLQIFPVP